MKLEIHRRVDECMSILGQTAACVDAENHGLYTRSTESPCPLTGRPDPLGFLSKAGKPCLSVFVRKQAPYVRTSSRRVRWSRRRREKANGRKLQEKPVAVTFLRCCFAATN